MGYPTIDKFDIKFVERTLANVKSFHSPNKFTHLINSMIGLVIIPHEFSKGRKKRFEIEFLNQPINDFQELKQIFSGNTTLIDEKGMKFNQQKFFAADKNGNARSLDNTNVGELLRLFRNGIAHQNITPVAEGDYWKGIIVRNYRNHDKERNGTFDFECFMNQMELRLFSTFIAERYLRARRSK